eukprot:1725872-Pleurochrysis_carterae.AAC.2
METIKAAHTGVGQNQKVPKLSPHVRRKGIKLLECREVREALEWKVRASSRKTRSSDVKQVSKTQSHA